MGNTTAKIISVVFHPLLMTTYVFVGLVLGMPLKLNFSPELSLKFISMVGVTTFFIPMTGILVLKVTRTISKLEMDDRRERFFPFLFITLFYIATTYLFYDRFRFPPVIINILIGVSSSLIVLTAITLYWKISAHAIAAAGAVGIFLALLDGSESDTMKWVLITFLLITGIVASSRLKLNAHSSSQVWVAILIGFSLNFILLLLL